MERRDNNDTGSEDAMSGSQTQASVQAMLTSVQSSPSPPFRLQGLTTTTNTAPAPVNPGDSVTAVAPTLRDGDSEADGIVLGLSASHSLTDGPRANAAPPADEDPDATAQRLRRELEVLRARAEADKVNSELLFKQLEQKVERATAEKDALRAQKDELRKRCTELEGKLGRVEGIAIQSRQQLTQEKSASGVLTKERGELLTINTKQQDEIRRLRDENRDYSEKSIALNSKICELQGQLSDIEMAKHTHQSEAVRLRSQLELAEKNARWADEQLTKKSEAFLELRSRTSARIEELSGQVESQSSQSEVLKKQLSAARTRVIELTSDLEKRSTLMREVETEKVSALSAMEAELSTQTKLSKLLEENLKKERQKVLAQQKAIEAGRARAEAARQLETQVLELTQRLEASKAETQRAAARMTELKKRLTGTGASSSAEAGSSGDAGAAETAPARQSETERQVRQVESYHEVQTLRRENIKLKQTLTNINRNLQRKKPILQEQRLRFERAVRANKDLSQKLSDSLKEADLQKERAERLSGRSLVLSREKKEMTSKLRDAVTQVLELLGKKESVSPSGLIGSAQAQSSDVITRKLVRFSSVQELYEQHQRTLAVARALTEKLDSVEKDFDARSADRLKSVRAQLEDMRSSREALETRVLALQHQLERSKQVIAESVLKNQLVGARDGGPSMDGAAPMSLVPSGSATDASNSASKQLEALRQEHDRYVTEKTALEKRAREELSKLKEESRDLRMRLARAEIEVKYGSEQRDRLRANVKGYKSELDALRERESALNADLAKHKARIQDSVKSLYAEQARRKAAEKAQRESAAEISVVRRSEARLSRENAALLEAKQRSTSLMATLQSMQQSMVRQEDEKLKSALKEKADMYAELERVKRRLEESQESGQEAVRNRAVELEALRKKADRALAEAAAAQTRFHEADKVRLGLEHKLEQAATQARELQAAVRAAEAATEEERQLRQQMLGGGEDAEVKRRQQLEADLKSVRAELKISDQTAAETRQQMEKFKLLASESDRALKAYTSSREEERSALEAKIAGLDKQKGLLAGRVKELQEHCLASDREVETQKDQISALEEKLRAEVAEARAGREAAEKALADVKGDVERFESEAKRQTAAAQDAAIRFEREVLLHVEKSKQLRETEAKLAESLEDKASLEARASAWETKLQDASKEAEAAAAEAARQAEGLEARIAEMRRENDLLQSQLETVAAQNEAIRKESGLFQTPLAELYGASGDSGETSASAAAATAAAAGDAKTVSELRELLRMVRGEKERAELKLRRALQRAARFEGLYSNEKKSLADARQELKASTARADAGAAKAVTAEEHQKLMGEVATLNLLHESNAQLRAMSERDRARAKDLEARCASLESELDPLRRENAQVKGEVEILQSERQLLEKDLERWKRRNHQLLEKYQMVDKQVHETLLKDFDELKQSSAKTVANAQAARDAAAADLAKAQGEAKALEDAKTSLATEHKELKERFNKLRANAQKWSKAVKDLRSKNKALEAKSQAAQSTLEQTRAADTKLRKLVACLRTARLTLKAQAAAAQESKKIFEAKLKAAAQKAAKDAQKRASETEAMRKEAQTAKKSLAESRKVAQGKIKDLKTRLKTAKQAEDSYRSQIANMMREKRKMQRATSTASDATAQPTAETKASEAPQAPAKSAEPAKAKAGSSSASAPRKRKLIQRDTGADAAGVSRAKKIALAKTTSATVATKKTASKKRRRPIDLTASLEEEGKAAVAAKKSKTAQIASRLRAANAKESKAQDQETDGKDDVQAEQQSEAAAAGAMEAENADSNDKEAKDTTDADADLVAKQKQLAEEAAKAIEEKKAKEQAAAAEKAKRAAAIIKAKREAAARAAKKEAAARAAKKEAAAKKLAILKAKKAAALKAKKTAEEKARKEAEEEARKQAEEKKRKEAEEEARKEAEEKARKQAEEKKRKEAEEKERKEAEEKAQQQEIESASEQPQAEDTEDAKGGDTPATGREDADDAADDAAEADEPAAAETVSMDAVDDEGELAENNEDEIEDPSVEDAPADDVNVPDDEPADAESAAGEGGDVEVDDDADAGSDDGVDAEGEMGVEDEENDADDAIAAEDEVAEDEPQSAAALDEEQQMDAEEPAPAAGIDDQVDVSAAGGDKGEDVDEDAEEEPVAEGDDGVGDTDDAVAVAEEGDGVAQ